MGVFTIVKNGLSMWLKFVEKFLPVHKAKPKLIEKMSRDISRDLAIT